jgi:hypothetical protein
MSTIEDHEHWLARGLDEDFGIDAEAELTEDGLFGNIIKLQFKSSQAIQKNQTKIRLTVERKYLEYARSCRYPVVFIAADITAREAWYLWLQKWLLEERAKGNHLDDQKSYTLWIPRSQTIHAGLDSAWKDIARWRTETQLVLSLIDFLRTAAANYDEKLILHTVGILKDVSPKIADASLDVIIAEAASLGNRLVGSVEVYTISKLLYPLLREFGGKLSRRLVIEIVQRGESYSRIGLNGLGILYDDFFEHIASFGLADYFVQQELSEVAYYCALRETFPNKKSLDFLNGPGDFVFAGLRFVATEDDGFPNIYANRGVSAILDFLDFART